MGKRTDIDRRLRTLTDISAILRVMRTLAIMETAKLSRFLAAQTRVVKSIEAAAADFLYFYPEVAAPPQNAVTVLLMIGSERGFCGDFSDTILRARAELHPETASPAPVLMAVGARLCDKFPPEALGSALAGASTVEEVPSVISRVIEGLSDLAVKGALRLTVLSHGQEDGGVASRTLQPFPEDLAPAGSHWQAPILNLPPALFYSELTNHYLFAALHELFYRSLMAENRQRQQHIDQAARRMDQKIAALNLRKNAVRQEEIIEEIEILMLSSEPEFRHIGDSAPKAGLNSDGSADSEIK